MVFDFIRKKKDYAVEFKDAFEATDVNRMIKIVQEWQKSDQHDKNCSCAVIILSALSDKIDINDVKNLYDSIRFKSAQNKELEGWYDTTVRLVFKTKGIDV